MNSRGARNLIPLAVELAFALIIGIIIVATDGGRYGLGAKAALDRLLDRYGDCQTYTATVRETVGEYPDLDGDSPDEASGLRTFHLAYGGLRTMAGSVTLGGRTRYYIRSGTSEREEGDSLEYVAGSLVLPLDPRPWQGPLVHAVFLTAPEWRDSVEPVSVLFKHCWADYVELRRRPGPGGRPCDVLVLMGRQFDAELWLDADGNHVRAVVWKGLPEPYTELYDDVAFDAPVDEALFDLGGEGFERLREWITERESAPTE